MSQNLNSAVAGSALGLCSRRDVERTPESVEEPSTTSKADSRAYWDRSAG
jgi:hypothetical protein